MAIKVTAGILSPPYMYRSVRLPDGQQFRLRVTPQAEPFTLFLKNTPNCLLFCHNIYIIIIINGEVKVWAKNQTTAKAIYALQTNTLSKKRLQN